MLPAPVPGEIKFDRDVRPILEKNCLRCHGPEKRKSHFRLDNRDRALNGGDDNPDDIVPGHSERSKLIRYVAGLDKDMPMPPSDSGEPLTPQQVGVLRSWIDQGAIWGTNSEPELTLEITPQLRWIGVQGNNKKFRELEGVPGGFGGGVENFSLTEQINPDEKLSVEGRARLPENDFKWSLAFEKNDIGFVRGGFEEWRKYYDDTGGFYPQFSPSSFSAGRDLHEDIGRVWIDFGLTLPDRPQLIFGYEYQFREGAESTLIYGTAIQNGVSKNIFPDTENINEHTHIFKLDVSQDWNGWNIRDQARFEIYRLSESRNDVASYSAGPLPDVIQNVNQRVHYTLGANTFRVEKQITDWWLASFGSLLSRYNGTSAMNQNASDGDGAPAFGNYWSGQGITLERDSRIVSLASLFLPAKGLSISTAAQGEWTTENGFGSVDLDFGNPAVPGLYFPFPGTVNANQDITEYSEDIDIRFTQLPRTILYANARLQQEDVGQFDRANNTLEPFAQRTDAQNEFYDAKAGFTVSPWMWTESGAFFRRRESITDYNHSVDQSILGGEGYPAFVRHRDIAMDEVEAFFVLRPVYWFNARLTYDWTRTDFSTVTDPVNDSFFGLLSPGGRIYDGRTDSHDAGLSVTFTPISQLYFSGSFTYGYSSTRTTAAASPEVAPYFGNTYTAGASIGYALNEKTDLTVSYAFSRAKYAQNNSAGIPLGLDFTRHELFATLSRQLTKNLSATLHYQFSGYDEPGTGNAHNFTAHGIFATFIYRWP
ncbi:MAG TPA: c-type cytochrome domain-containing protein [Verrucomicrobiae bacterium]|nr:c-type cytochrome domain-containing protein [Verrucomicrobiae bacterium]